VIRLREELSEQIKSGDPETYRRVTGQPLQPTLDHARRLSDLGRPMWVRSATRRRMGNSN